jgi:hypothetical protein
MIAALRWMSIARFCAAKLCCKDQRTLGEPATRALSRADELLSRVEAFGVRCREQARDTLANALAIPKLSFRKASHVQSLPSRPVTCT